MTAAALVFLVIKISSVWNRPPTTKSQPQLVAKTKAPPADITNTFPVVKQENPTDPKRRVNLGSEGDLLANNPRSTPKDAPLQAAPLPAEAAAKGNAAAQTEPSVRPSFAAGGFGGGSGGHLKPQIPADPQVGQILELAQCQGDRVVIVEVTVVDVQKTLGQLQVLFARHAVPPGNFQLNAPCSPAALNGGVGPTKNSSQYGLYVQSSSEQMSSTLAMLRRQQAISRLEAKTTLAMTQIPVVAAEVGNRCALRFEAAPSRQTLAQSVQNYEFRKRGQKSLRDADKIPAAEKVTPETGADGTKAPKKPAADRPQPSVDLSKLQVPAAKDATQDKLGNMESFQLMVQTPAEDWLANQPPKANSPASAKPPLEAGSRKKLASATASDFAENEKAEAKQEQTSAPVRLMFLFREQSQPAKP